MRSAAALDANLQLTAMEFAEQWAAHERDSASLAIAARRLEVSGGPPKSSVLSTGHVTALQGSCPTLVEPVMHTQQAELVAIVAPLSVSDTEAASRVWRQRAEAIVETAAPIEPDRHLRPARTADGLVGSFVLDTAGAVQFSTAIRIASTWDGNDDARSHQRRSADALIDVCAFFSTNHDHPGTPRNRPHIELDVDNDTLSSTPTAWTPNHHLDATTTDGLLCDPPGRARRQRNPLLRPSDKHRAR